MQGLMESGKDADIILIQEPWIGSERRGRRIEGQVRVGGGKVTVGSANYEIIYKQDGQRDARVMAMVRKDKGMKYSVRSDVWDCKDGMIIDIETIGGRFRLVNVYNQRYGGGEEGWAMRSIPDEAVQGERVLMVGDFNAKSIRWDPGVEEIRERMVLDITDKYGMVLLNEIGRATWFRGAQKSVLDLAWSSAELEGRCNWEVGEETGSDHELIKISVQLEEEVVKNVEERYNFKKADWERVRERWGEMERERSEEWDRMRREQDVDSMATEVGKWLGIAIEAGVPKAKPCWRSKPWFDEEVKEARKRICRERNWERREMKFKGGGERWKERRNEYFRLIRRKKKMCWEKYIEEAKGKDMWGVWKVINRKKQAKMPSLKVEGREVVEFADKHQQKFLALGTHT